MKLKPSACLILILCSILPTAFVTSAKNKYTVKIVQPDPVKAPIIDVVTVSPTNKNIISWEPQANERIHHFNIYRDVEPLDNEWQKVAEVNYPNLTFTDLSSFPQIRAYKYKISAVDQCGNEVFTQTIHKTIQLTARKEANANLVLNWTPYQGFQVSGYKIYRGNALTNMIDLVSTNAETHTFTDDSNPGDRVLYQIEAIEQTEVPDPLTKSGLLAPLKTRSNIVSASSILSFTDSLDAFNLKLSPNPMTTNALVSFPYTQGEAYQLSILDLTGRPIYSKQIQTGEFELQRGNLKEGLYIIQIAGKKIFRKKIMIGKA